MENLLLFLDTNLDKMLFSLIILSGIYVTKYSVNVRISNTYKVLLSSIIISIFLYFIENCDKTCLNKYLFTYFFATSFYELFVKLIMTKIKNYTNK